MGGRAFAARGSKCDIVAMAARRVGGAAGFVDSFAVRPRGGSGRLHAGPQAAKRGPVPPRRQTVETAGLVGGAVSRIGESPKFSKNSLFVLYFG